MRILIVEDEKKMAAVLKKGLEADNHRVSLAFDGRSGLELASTTEFDVVVLDLMLPVIDGFEVVANAAEKLTRVAVQERYKFPGFLCAPWVPYRALRCDRCLVITTFWNMFAPFHGANAGSNPAGDGILSMTCVQKP